MADRDIQLSAELTAIWFLLENQFATLHKAMGGDADQIQGLAEQLAKQAEENASHRGIGSTDTFAEIHKLAIERQSAFFERVEARLRSAE